MPNWTNDDGRSVFDKAEPTAVKSVRERRAEVLRKLLAADHPLDNLRWALNALEAIDRGER